MSEQVIGNSTSFSPRSQLRPNAFGQFDPVLVTLDAFALIGTALLAQAGAAHLAEQTADPLRLAAIAAFPTAFTLPLMALCGAYDADAASRPRLALKALVLIWPCLLPLAWLLAAGLQIHLDAAQDGLTTFAVMGPAGLLAQRFTLAALLRRSALGREAPFAAPAPEAVGDLGGVEAAAPGCPPGHRPARRRRARRGPLRPGGSRPGGSGCPRARCRRRARTPSGAGGGPCRGSRRRSGARARRGPRGPATGRRSSAPSMSSAPACCACCSRRSSSSSPS
ncbi:hypothetical protein [Methylorubrum aminovorans]|uniref:hypothetical protein n=1 Tax=Methylorubrum aminovorans TaxID=269069 RepID=UPI0024E0CFF5|nr:hypothetical protein [Methylorubrum aminovorans]